MLNEKNCTYLVSDPHYTYVVRHLFLVFCFEHFYFPASGQAAVTGVVPSSPRFLPSIFIAHRVQQSHCSSIVYRVLLTRALALTARQFVHKKKFPRMNTEYASGGLELTKLTYTRLEDDLIRHRGERSCHTAQYSTPRHTAHHSARLPTDDQVS